MVKTLRLLTLPIWCKLQRQWTKSFWRN